MAKLIRYRIIAAVQFFLVFFFMMLVSDYTQYDAEMFNLKINTIYEREYDYLDCKISDQQTEDDNVFHNENLQSYWFYDFYQFDIQKTDDVDKIFDVYLNPTCVVQEPTNAMWIAGKKPMTNDEIALGQTLFSILNEQADHHIMIGSKISVTVNTLVKNNVRPPFEVTVTGVYSSDVTVFSPASQDQRLVDSNDKTHKTGQDGKKYNPLNESFYIPSASTIGGFRRYIQAMPQRVLVEIPENKDSLVKLYHENHRVRSCIDSFVIDSSHYFDNGYEPRMNLVYHKRYLEISMIIFGIICVFAVPLLVLFLFAATQLAIIENEDKPITNIFVKELIFYSLILLGGGLIYTIYTIIFPWVLLVKPILISTFSFAGILLLNWLLIFIWKYKELSRNL